MSILSWRSSTATNTASPRDHLWAVYLNPRDKKIQIAACSQCGMLKDAALSQKNCTKIPERANNALLNRGWVQQRLTS